jgi:hypothetical protein
MGISQQIGASSLIKAGVIDNTANRPASPYEGQVIFQKDTDQLLVWNGTVWVIPNSPAQNPQGLEFITAQTIGTAVSSVTVSNCFSSTYDNYFINMGNGGIVSSYGPFLRFSLAGVTTNLWYGTGYYMQNASTITGFATTGTSYGYAGIGETGSYGFKIDIQSPFLTKQKDFMVQYIGGGTSTYSGIYNSHCNSSASCASFTITPEYGTLTGGTITVYGYRKS